MLTDTLTMNERKNVCFYQGIKKKGLSQLTMFYTAASFEEGRIFSLNVEIFLLFPYCDSGRDLRVDLENRGGTFVFRTSRCTIFLRIAKIISCTIDCLDVYVVFTHPCGQNPPILAKFLFHFSLVFPRDYWKCTLQ